MNIKARFSAALLSAALLTGMGVTGASVSASDGYSDVTDEGTSFAVSVLENLGVVEGYPDSGFHPEETLTRAQFCKLAICLLGLEDELSAASRMTIYSDVISTHWASAYVNLASSEGLINGYGDGRFGPDDGVSFAQAVVICLRMLGYSQTDIGEYYPDDYLRFAEKLGLTDRFELSADDTVTRADAALLLSDMLGCEMRSGKLFCETIASDVLSNVILLDEDCVSPYGMLNAVKLYMNGQIVYYTHAQDISGSMIGREGIALLDRHDRILAFLPLGAGYTVKDGILISGNTYEDGKGIVKLYADGKQVSYPRANTIASNLNGSSGTLLINSYGYAVAFIAGDGESMKVVENAVLVSNDSTSDSGKKNCALFYVDGQAVWYQIADTKPNASLVGSVGTVILNSDGKLQSYTTDGNVEYRFEYAIVTEVHNYTAEFYNGESNVRRNTDCKLTQSSVGAGGIVMLDKLGNVGAFIELGNESYTFSSSGILMMTDSDSYLIKNGKLTEYDGNGDISDSMQGALGRLMLNDKERVVTFIVESSLSATEIETESAEIDRVFIYGTELGRYIPEDTYTIYNGELTAWEDIYRLIGFCDMTIYYDDGGDIAFVEVRA